MNYGIERLNLEVAAWMRGENKENGGKALPPFLAMGNASSVMWNRSLSKEKWPSPSDRYSACRALQQALANIGAKRLIVGHTPQASLVGIFLIIMYIYAALHLKRCHRNAHFIVS